MARVPITVMGYQCERCKHEWVPRDFEGEPRVCPKCKSAYWNQPRKKTMMTYQEFSEKIRNVLQEAKQPLTWTEVRTVAGLTQLYPNNRWVRRMEQDIGLYRHREHDGVIHWQLGGPPQNAATTSTAPPPKPNRSRTGRKEDSLERGPNC